MKIFQIKAYSFDELSEIAKKKVIEEYRKNDMAWTDDDNNELSFSFEAKLHEYGFEDETAIDFSLTNSQGDGVAFYGSIDVLHWLKNHDNEFTQKEMKRLLWANTEYGIEMGTIVSSLSIHYSHAHTMICYSNIDGEYCIKNAKLIDNVIEKVSTILKKEIIDLSRELEKFGYESIDNKEKEEIIIEDIKNNNFMFNEDGTFLNIDGRHFYVK